MLKNITTLSVISFRHYPGWPQHHGGGQDSKDHPEGRIFGDPRATKAILQFLTDTTIGTRRGADQALYRTNTGDEWGLAALEEEERGGEG